MSPGRPVSSGLPGLAHVGIYPPDTPEKNAEGLMCNILHENFANNRSGKLNSFACNHVRSRTLLAGELLQNLKFPHFPPVFCSRAPRARGVIADRLRGLRNEEACRRSCALAGLSLHPGRINHIEFRRCQHEFIHRSTQFVPWFYLQLRLVCVLTPNPRRIPSCARTTKKFEAVTCTRKSPARSLA